MMGWTHAATGTLGFGGATLLYRFGLPDIALGTVITTGAALINDLDHHKGTMTKSLGPLSWVVSRLVILIFGGHRKGTHSLLFVVLLGLGAQLALNARHTIPGLIALCVFMVLPVASVIRLAKIKGWIDDIIPGIGVVLLVWLTDIDLRIVPGCLMSGALIHILGDCLTDRGCPLFWPLSKKKFTLDLFTTGKGGEKITSVVVVIGILTVIVYQVLILMGIAHKIGV